MPLLTAQQTLELAIEHHRAGRFAEAEALYQRLLTQHPGSVDVIHLLGVLAWNTGRYAEAFDRMQRAIAAQPNVARYYSDLGLLLGDWNRLDESATALETARRLDPGSAAIHHNLGRTRASQRQWEAAIRSYHTALELDPRHDRAWLNLGVALASAGQREEAITAYRTGRKHCPDAPALVINLGSLLQELGRLDEAYDAFREALALVPQSFVVLNNLGALLKDRGDIAGAIRTFQESLASEPNAEVHSNLIFTQLFDPATEAAAIREEQGLWNCRFAIPLRGQIPRHRNDRSAERRLRIGYVSADLRNHVVGRTLLPIFESHDPAHVECVCYAKASPDSVAQRFQARADLWREMDRWTDAELAAQVQADGIDILVDLGLHTAYNRLLTFARKPAPVQVSWLGYPGGTGLEAIDWWLTDRFLEPPAAEPAKIRGQPFGTDAPERVPPVAAPAESSGRPFHLPDAWCCYPCQEDSPEVSAPPVTQTGHITFGSFNNFAKINEQVLELWSQILGAVPASRLLLLGKAGGYRDTVKKILQKRGIVHERLEFVDYQAGSPTFAARDYLQRYARVDIALDPFPYNGMTTTGDALWMGVPVVARCGATRVSRASFSLLSNIGLPELAAQTEEGYVQLAISLAQDPSRLARLRATLRPRMQESPLLDAPRFARNLEAAYREMWRRWCRGETELPSR